MAAITESTRSTVKPILLDHPDDLEDFHRPNSQAAFDTVLLCSAWMRLWKIKRPSALPSIVSHARSGCGINPPTLRRSLHIPAIFQSEPLEFAASVSSL